MLKRLLLCGGVAVVMAAAYNYYAHAQNGFITQPLLDLSGYQTALPDCPVPAADSLNGSTGVASPCKEKSDSQRPTAVQAGNTTLDGTCQFSFTFARSFTSSSPFAYAAVVDNTNTMMPCKIKTRSSTTVTGVCKAEASTLLSLSIVTTGLTLLPFSNTCTNGTAVMVVGREPTQ